LTSAAILESHHHPQLGAINFQMVKGFDHDQYRSQVHGIRFKGE